MITAAHFADHKAILITGAAQRMGRALAIGLAKEQWAVAVHYRNSQKAADALVAEIIAGGGQAASFNADLNQPKQIEALMQAAISTFGPITALINNASTFARDLADDFSTASWDAHVNVNLRAPALLMRDFAQQTHFAHGAHDGCIVNMTDQRVYRLTPDFMSYTLTKSGLHTLTQTYAQALADKHIRVNAIAPGPTVPNRRQEQTDFDKQAALVPLHHGASLDDIVHAVRYLLAAAAVTGQTLTVDGGQHLAWQTPDVMQAKE